MKELIKQIHEIIKDYRREDLNFLYRQEITEKHIENWINQFDEEDREFILTELLHLLPNSYLSKDNTLDIIGKEFEVYKKDFKYGSVQDFLKVTKFIKCQGAGKSQTKLLEFTDEIIQELYGMSLDDCGTGEIENWMYVDDVIASGGTFRNEIYNEIESFGIEKFKESTIRIISTSFILHNWGKNNATYVLKQRLGYSVENRIHYYRVKTIDNNPHINWYHQNPEFNHVYPIESDIGKEFLDFIENAFDREYEMKNEQHAFRNAEYPKEEKFYSSKENRIRYENILLKKGIDIINDIDNLTVPSIRPLGLAPPSHKTLGTGSHFFSWRNISNTCPLVFWWETNGWTPLLPRKH